MRISFTNFAKKLIIIFLLVSTPVQATSYYQPNAFVEAMRTMLRLFLLMGQGMTGDTFGYHLPNRDWLNNQPWSPEVTPFNTPDNPNLNGTWVSNTGFILVIRGGYARIAISQEEFQDFYIRYKPGVAQFRGGLKGEVFNFRMLQQNNRLSLQDQQGRALLFLKIQ